MKRISKVLAKALCYIIFAIIFFSILIGNAIINEQKKTECINKKGTIIENSLGMFEKCIYTRK